MDDLVSDITMNFTFWGLFLVLGLILAGYLFWMVGADRRDAQPPPPLPEADR